MLLSDSSHRLGKSRYLKKRSLNFKRLDKCKFIRLLKVELRETSVNQSCGQLGAVHDRFRIRIKQIISKFEKHPIGSQDGKGLDAEVLVWYFNPCGSETRLITEAEREGEDWRMFGFCYIHAWEWRGGADALQTLMETSSQGFSEMSSSTSKIADWG